MLQFTISLGIWLNGCYLYLVLLTAMITTLFGGLLTTPAPTAPLVGIAFMALFGVMAVVVGPNYDGFNDPNSSK